MVAPVAIWRGYVLTILWGWFIVPTFNAPALSVATAIGIALVVGMFSTTKESNKEEKDNALVNYLLNGFVAPALALGIGYLITLYK
jgi:hypothetical protein